MCYAVGTPDRTESNSHIQHQNQQCTRSTCSDEVEWSGDAVCPKSVSVCGNFQSPNKSDVVCVLGVVLYRHRVFLHFFAFCICVTLPHDSKMSITKHSKMLQFVNYRMRVTLDDKRTLVGRFIAFDKHMNLVLADCEEFRSTKSSGTEERRALGLVLLRGECVVSLAVESAPAPKEAAKPGSIRAPQPLGRGVPLGRVAPMPGLTGPAPGLGAGGVPGMQAMPPPPGFTAGRGLPPPMAAGRGMPPPPGFASNGAGQTQ